MPVNLQQVITDIVALGKDTNLPADIASLKLALTQPSLQAGLAALAQLESDPSLVKILTDITPTQLQILTAMRALGFIVTVPTATPAPAA